MAAQLFILFPEQSGATTTFPHVEADTIPAKFVSHINNVLRGCERVCEKDKFTFFYNHTNAKNFKDAFIKDEKELTLFRSILKKAMIWDNGVEALSEEYQSTAIYGEPEMSKQSITIVEDEKAVQLEVISMNLYEMYRWISEHRVPQRIYEWNPKHGENGKGAISLQGEEVSPLLSSKEAAAELLPYAIGIKKDNKLYIFDDAFDCFEEFAQGRGSYHSYHLQNEKNVPRSIRINWKELMKSKESK